MAPPNEPSAERARPECARREYKAMPMFGIHINSLSLQETFDAIDKQIKSGQSGFIVTPNIDHICILSEDKDFQKAYQTAFLVLPDGTPLMWAAKLLGKPLKEKISGSDLVYALAEHAAEQGHSLYLLGAAPGIAEKAAKILQKTYPGLIIAGHYSPPLGFEKNPRQREEVIQRLKAAAPDICYVALGCPKQDHWNAQYHHETGIPVSIGIGASLDFIAGTVQRAPVWMQKSGLEWFFRLCQEPRRLWRRYLIQDSKFIPIFLKELLARAKQ